MHKFKASLATKTPISGFDSYLQRVNSFALEVIKQNSFDDVLWCIVESIGKILELEDCVIYRLEENRLIQAAAWGIKAPTPRCISSPFSVSVGEGIVGAVAKSGVAELVADTGSDARYLFDEFKGRSEITVPIEFEGNILGVIDCESAERNGLDESDLHLLIAFANISAPRIAQSLVQLDVDRLVNNLM